MTLAPFVAVSHRMLPFESSFVLLFIGDGKHVMLVLSHEDFALCESKRSVNSSVKV